MTRITTPFNANDIITLRNEGLTFDQIKNKLSIPIAIVRMVIRSSSCIQEKIIKKPHDIFAEQMISMFNNGSSTKQIAKAHFCSRNVVSRIFKERGIIQRNRSEAMFNRIKFTSKEDIKKLTSKANEVMRRMPKEFHRESAIKQAIAKSKSLSKVGDNELYVFEQLKINNIKPIQHAPIDVYNIDILCGNTVIEVHKESCHPHNRAMYLKRIKFLLKSGFNVFYIKWSKATPINIFAINELVSFINQPSINKTNCSQYRVIRGTGERLFSGCMDGDNLSIIKTSNC